MKLIDLLARELTTWPDSTTANYCVADRHGEVFFGGGVKFQLSQVPEDHERGQVTRDAWEAAAKSLKSIPWTGEGLPPVCEDCELWLGDGSWVPCTVMCHDLSGTMPVAVVRYAEHTYAAASPKILRPIRTAEQIAAEEHEEAAEDLFCSLCPEGKWHKFPEEGKAVYRSAIAAGWRKQVQP